MKIRSIINYIYTLSIVFLICLETNFGQTYSDIEKILSEVNSDSLKNYVMDLSGERLISIDDENLFIESRYSYDSGNEIAAKYIKKRLLEFDYSPNVQIYSKTGKNIFAQIKGAKFPNKYIIISAHYDSMPGNGLAPGADDNASGTAAVLEAARVLKGQNFDYTVVFAFWDEEEQSLTGSDYYVSHLKQDGSTILGVINLDMIAWDSDDNNHINIHTRDDGFSNILAKRVFETNQTYNIGLVPDVIMPGISASDHASFWKNNIPALLVIEDDNEDFNENYHKSSDKIRDFNFSYFEKCSKLAIASTAVIAKGYTIDISHNEFDHISTIKDIPIYADVKSNQEIGVGLNGPKLFFRVRNNNSISEFHSILGKKQGNSLYSFLIPSQKLGSIVEYYFEVKTEDNKLTEYLPNDFTINPKKYYSYYIADISEELTSTLNDEKFWVKTGSWGFVSDGNSNIIQSSTEEKYKSNENSFIETQHFININNSIGLYLVFDAKWNLEETWDFSQVSISTDGILWKPIWGLYTNKGEGAIQPANEPLYDGKQKEWIREKLDISEYINKGFKIRISFSSDDSNNFEGIYFKNLKLLNYLSREDKIVSSGKSTHLNK